MRVFLDSGAIQASSIKLNSPDLLALWAHAEREDVHLYTSEVVIEELVSHYAAALKRALREAEVQLRNLNGFADTGLRIDREDTRWKNLVEEYRVHLRHLFEETGGQIVPLPSPPYEELIRRAIAKERPFTKGTDGLKDMMIWLSAVDVARTTNEEILFVSGNTDDFGEVHDGIHVLHEDLIADLTVRDGEHHSAKLVTSVSVLVNDFLLPEIGPLVEIEEKVKSLSWEEMDLPHGLNALVATGLEKAANHWASLPDWRESGLLDIDMVEDVDLLDFGLVRATRIKGGYHLLVEANFTVHMYIEAQSDTYFGDKLEIDDIAERWSIRRGSVSMPLSGRLTYLFDKDWTSISEAVEFESSELIVIY